MKKTVMLFILFQAIFYSTRVTAQEASPKFENLKLNSSPGFIVLGIEPDNIQRPGTPSKFIGGILNSTVNGKLKPNIAVELSPYYLINQKDTNSKRLETDFLKKTGFFKTIGKTLTLSIATSESDTVVFGKLKPGTGLGTGLRFLLIDGKINEDLRTWNLKRIKLIFFQSLLARVNILPADTTLNLFYVTLDREMKQFTKESFKNLDYYGYTDNEIEGLLKDWKDDISYYLATKKVNNNASLSAYIYSEQKSLGSEEQDLLKIINAKKNPLAKEGFMLEFAAGQSVVFQKNEWSGIAHAKTAFWLTPSWRINLSKSDITLFDFMGVIRYTINNKKDSVDIANYVDMGLKAQLTQNNWSASLEFISRWASQVPITTKEKYTYRLAAGIDYKISNELTFKFSFGSNFDGNTKTYSDPRQMFVLGGLNIGLFK